MTIKEKQFMVDSGPSWLSKVVSAWPIKDVVNVKSETEATVKTVRSTAKMTENEFLLINKYSS